jgi:hypothetical protein
MLQSCLLLEEGGREGEELKQQSHRRGGEGGGGSTNKTAHRKKEGRKRETEKREEGRKEGVNREEGKRWRNVVSDSRDQESLSQSLIEIIPPRFALLALSERRRGRERGCQRERERCRRKAYRSISVSEDKMRSRNASWSIATSPRAISSATKVLSEALSFSSTPRGPFQAAPIQMACSAVG